MWRKRDLESELWVSQRTLLLTQEKLTIAQERLKLEETRNLALRDDLARLMTYTQELASRPAPTRSSTPLYMSESEEDVRYMKETQQISIEEAEQLLRELEFENDTILVDNEDLSLI